ncbi:hypothetical protein Clacol_007259 [Clathrus columnatus]|uniref:Multiple myeloma tumor-associated protein 2-like N-terminal domain-containing protein n=1 Tax=Clathrus columnatus TaxID=1419009 RepID=A0AAV5AJG7_9AGAM|nr:hypothetical protein Clacol_007259 [Clathrus columnatus]
MFDGPVRGGNRGGHTDFKWSDVSADKDREVGHSINAPTGRWQKNKDVHWYNRDHNGSEEARREELRKVKEAEAEALAVALGFKPASKPGQITAQTTDELKPLETEATKEERQREKEERRKRKEEKRALKEIKRARKLEKTRSKDRPRSEEGYHSRYRSKTLSRSRSPPPRGDRHLSRSPYRHRSRSPYHRSKSPYQHRVSRSRSRSPQPGGGRFDGKDGHRDYHGRRIEPADRGYRR